MEPPVTAVYDANILYRAPLRDLLIRVAQTGLVRARWTQAIHDEWMGNVLKSNPQLSTERLARTRTLMDEAVRDCLVTGHEDLIDSPTLPDPDDRHVLAAAIRAGAEVIVTYNPANSVCPRTCFLPRGTPLTPRRPPTPEDRKPGPTSRGQ